MLDVVVDALPEMRALAESLMRETFAAYSPGATTTDANGYEVDGFTSEGSTSGKVSSQSRGGDPESRTVTIGGSDRPVLEGGLHIPLSAPLPAIDWEYECTAVGPLSDPGLLGRRYRVTDVPLKSFATARRLDVVDVTDLS